MSAPAGWHLQGDGRERFWDGSQWTDQFRPPTQTGGVSAPAAQRGRKSWFARHKVLTVLGALLVIGVVGSATSGGGGGSSLTAASTNPSSAASSSAASSSGTPAPSSSSAAPSPSSSSKTPAKAAAPVAPPKPAPKPAAPPAPPKAPAIPAAPAAPPLTGPQQNAVSSAQGYLDMSGFSRLGLIGQLSSSAGEGYSRNDATVAVDSLHVDRNAQAVRSAKEYLAMSAFSCSGLIEQLSSSAGEQYTQAQASYGAHHTAAC